MGNKYLYKPTSLAGFLQQIVWLVTRGYKYFHVTYYPESKKDKWIEIDKKLIGKYQTDMTRSQRYRNKQKKNGNFMFLRYENVAVLLLATDDFKKERTKVKERIVIDDEFFDIEEKNLKFDCGKISSFKIHKTNNTVTVSMANKMFKEVKANLIEVAATKNLSNTRYEFEKLNGLPSWHGINKQKFQLLDLVVDELKHHNVKVKKTTFFVKLSRKKVKVFE
ncbi:hypothetical protein LF817_19790 [Halobacillus sp. A1]|uniref:hypothetical protein n=1 Tax=Halobacillus sp. A1 TaxID=2880262 RepID=UPI0020A67D18|nr:hypothetical protein [Halobacillus sp. A1]MCP3033569.1 hypothetical protein [Halobacillus sp. A1]